MKNTYNKYWYKLLFAGIALTLIISFFTFWTNGREQLKVALFLKDIPSSVKNIQYGEDSWTDDVIHVYCEIAPQDFKKLLIHRKLKIVKSPIPLPPHQITPPKYAKTIPLFVAEETYYSKSPNFYCKLVTTKKHDKVYIVYASK